MDKNNNRPPLINNMSKPELKSFVSKRLKSAIKTTDDTSKKVSTTIERLNQSTARADKALTQGLNDIKIALKSNREDK